MKIIITGSLGHIGSFLIRDFANKFSNVQFILLDNMMTQRFPSLFNLPKLVKYTFIETNIIQYDLDSILCPDDIVIHLAAITDAAGSFDRAEELEKNNFLATKKVAESCLKSGAKLISLSSTSVYGTQNLIVSEDCSPEELKPQSPYAVTKLKEEEFILDLFTNQGLKAVIFRFGTIFGISQGMRFHTAVNKFCWQAVMQQPITVWRTAYDQKRPYLDLKDASNAFIHVIKNNIFDGEIYNVLTLNATVKQIVDSIKEYVPLLRIDFVDSKIMNQLSYEVSCEKFTKSGFQFTGNLKEGVSDTINLLMNCNFKKSMITVAIIGAGYMANEHIKAFNDISDVCVVGIYSKTKLKSDKLAAIYNIQNVCDSIDELYKKTKADIVVVCTSVLSIHDVSIKCFRYNWVCLIEKPVGYNLEEAKSIFEQSVTSKSRVYVSLNRRNYSSTISVIESLKKISNNRLVHIYDQQNTINALLAGQPKAVVDNWMFANSIHLVDYFNIFCRGEVVKIDKILPWEGNSTNFILTKIQFDSGDIGIYESIWNAPGPWAVVITTTDIRWELRPLEQAFIQSNESRKLEPIKIKEQDIKFKPGLRQQAQEIVNVVLNKKNNAVLLSSAMKTMQLVDKIYFSN